MAQPTPYDRQFSFQDFQAQEPTTPLPGDEVDGEFNAVRLTIDQTLVNLAKIQRDDGALRNGIVTQDALSDSLTIGFTLRGAWGAPVNYLQGDGVVYNGAFYRALDSHLSVTGQTPDIRADLWLYLIDLNSFAPIASEEEAIAGVETSKYMTPYNTGKTIWARKATVSSTEYGVSEAASDNKAALEYAYAQALAEGKALKVKRGRYKFSTLSFPDTLVVESDGTIFACDPTGPQATFVDIGSITADSLNFEFNGAEVGSGVGAKLISVDDNCDIGAVSLISPTQLGYAAGLNGVIATGVGTRIGAIRASNIDYPLSIINPSTSVLATGAIIGDIVCDNYLRPLYLQYASAKVGDIKAKGRSSSAALISSPGRYISVLLEGVESTSLGNIHMEECGHGIRIGGSPHANARSRHITIGDMHVTKTRGCAFKVDPTLLIDASLPLSPYKTERAFDIAVGDITGVDIGAGTSEGNREFLRITRADKVAIGRARAFIQDESFSGQSGLGINNATDVKIAELYGDNFAAAHISINSDQDSDATQWAAGPVYGLTIPVLHGKAAGSTMLSVQSASFYTMEYGDIKIGLQGAEFGTNSSANTRVFNTATGGGGTPVFSSGRKIDIKGAVGTAYLPVFLNVPSNAAPDNFNVDMRWNGRRFTGVPSNPRFLAGHTVQAGGFEAGTPGNQITDGFFGTYYAVQIGTSAGNLVPGGIFVSSRPNSTRRGAAFGAVQLGASVTSIGAGLWTGLGAAGEDQLQLSASMRPDGFFELMHTNSNGLILLSETGVRKKLTVTNANTVVITDA